MRKSEATALTDSATVTMLKAIANPSRLQVLRWLKDPAAHFPPQVDGDMAVVGVCADFIRAKLGIGASTASRHLTLLVDAGLLLATRQRGWTFYQRDEVAIAAALAVLQEQL